MKAHAEARFFASQQQVWIAKTQLVALGQAESNVPWKLLALRQQGGRDASFAIPTSELLPRADCLLRSESD